MELYYPVGAVGNGNWCAGDKLDTRREAEVRSGGAPGHAVAKRKPVRPSEVRR